MDTVSILKLKFYICYYNTNTNNKHSKHLEETERKQQRYKEEEEIFAGEKKLAKDSVKLLLTNSLEIKPLG